MNIDGSGLRQVWKPDQGLLGISSWSADGSSIYVATNGTKTAR